jgi:hypothetical protein
MKVILRKVTALEIKTAMFCKMAQIPLEIWMILPLEAKKSKEKETSNDNMPNKYARVKNVAKEEDVIKVNKDQTYVLLMNFLKNI